MNKISFFKLHQHLFCCPNIRTHAQPNKNQANGNGHNISHWCCTMHIRCSTLKLTLNQASRAVRHSCKMSSMTAAARICNNQSHTFLALCLSPGCLKTPGNYKGHWKYRTKLEAQETHLHEPTMFTLLIIYMYC